MALHKDLWVAYSTENAALYKAWKGMVYFDGPVYTHAHGPQPISIGDGYQVSKYDQPWFWLANNKDTRGLQLQAVELSFRCPFTQQLRRYLLPDKA